jgi:prevent-host-death family protein
MKTAKALDVRRSLGKVLSRLDRGGEPIILERKGKPAAVLISLQAFRERFADLDAAEERKHLVEEILQSRAEQPPSSDRSTLEDLRALRGPLP